MQIYIAHFSSPVASDSPAKGLFEFESSSRLGTKGNHRDARLKMLEVYGKDALSWTIDRVERKKSRSSACTQQMELDFRAPKIKSSRAKKKEWW